MRRRLTIAAVLCVLAAAAWFLLLPWHAAKTSGADGFQQGPYSAVQVIALALVIGLLSVVGAAHGSARLTVVGLSLTTTLLFSLDAATQREAASFWPIGSALVLLATLLGTGLVCAVTRKALTRR